MKRSTTHAVLLLAMALSFFSCNTKSTENEKETRKPNIIFILADDLGYGDLGVYGQTKIETPHLDRLAQEGMKFTQAYSGSTVCAPSRSSLMTGQHTGHTPVRGNREYEPEGQFPLKKEALTIPEMLKAAGYVTGGFGKWGLGFIGTEGDPNEQGFDVFYGYNCQREAHRYYPGHLWSNDEKIILEGNDDVNTEIYAPDVIHEKTLDFIREYQDTAFFLYVPSVIPHAEIIAPDDELLAKYEGQFEETPWGFDNTGNVHHGNAYGAENFATPGYAPQEKPLAVFAAMVSRLDRQVGDIVALIDELGLADNTLIMFTSDNGPHEEGGADPDFFKSYGAVRGYKRDLYEGGIRVPFIAHWDGTVEAGSVTGHLTAFWDMMPTFADMAGIEKDLDTDGISIYPLLKGKTEQQKEHDFLYWEFHEQGGKQAVRMGKWKGIRLNVNKNPDAPIELYNLEKDIKELNNIADENPEVVEKIKTIMENQHVPNDDFPFGTEREQSN